MRRSTFRSISLLSMTMGIAASHPSLAQTANAPAQTWSLGAAAIWSASPYRHYDNEPLAVPTVSYESSHFFLRGIVLGYRPLSARHTELALIASPYSNRFLAKDSDDLRMRRLADRNVSGLAGVSWRLYGDWGSIQATAQKELTGHGGGYVTDLGYEYPLREGRFTLIPGSGFTYSSSALNDYYYGIRAKEVARSGLPEYRPGAAGSPFFKLDVVCSLSRSWLLIGSYRLTVLSGTVKNSPMVDHDFTESYLAGVSYVF